MIRYLIGAAMVAALLATPAQGQAAREGLLKICKVAGPGMKPDTQTFNFTVNGTAAASILAGPAPGGNCWIGGMFPVGSTVVVAEPVPAADVLTSVTSTGSITLSNPVPLSGPATESVHVVIGPGVTEVTFTNDVKKMGYIEICKWGTPGMYTFAVNPGGQTVTVPGMSCSPPIQVPSGSIAITETNPGTGLTGCDQWQGTWTACPVSGQTMTVNVSPGAINSQTVVLAINRERDVNSSEDALQKVLKSSGQ